MNPAIARRLGSKDAIRNCSQFVTFLDSTLGRTKIRFHDSRFISSTSHRSQEAETATQHPLPEGVGSARGGELFTAEHRALRETLARVIEKDINPFVDQWESEGKFPAHRVFKKLGDAGLLGLTKPIEYGGMGLDYSYAVAFAEELGGIQCAALPMAIGVQTDMATPALARFGSDFVKEEFLRPSISGDFVACLGVSEVGAGSDVASIKTKAIPVGDDFVINGGKMWTTNGTQADWMCLLANTSEGPAHQNKSLICLPMKTKGVHIARTIDKLGMRSSDTAEVFFEDVRVPKKYIVGEPGLGFTYQMLQFQEERLFAAASVLKSFDDLIQATADYTKQRIAFGQPILNNQTVHFRLAELATEVEALRSLVYRCTANFVNGEDMTKMASMAKLKAGRLGRELTDALLQFWGGMGFTSDVPISRAYRDVRLLSIGGGADEVMLSIICKYMDLLPKPAAKQKKK